MIEMMSNEELMYQDKLKRIDRLLFLGLLLTVAITPLIIVNHTMPFVGPFVDNATITTGLKTNFYTYYKFWFLTIMTGLLLIIFLYKVVVVGYRLTNIKLNVIYWLLGMFLTFSAVASNHKTIALFGLYDRFDGTITYLCYITLFYIAANININREKLIWFIYALIPFILVNTILGVINFYGFDVLDYDWLQSILFFDMPEGYSINSDSNLMSTLNNRNFMSGFSAATASMFLCVALLSKSNRERAIHFCFAILSFMLVIFSLSSNGFVTLFVMLAVLFLLTLLLKSNGMPLLLFGAYLVICGLLLSIFGAQNPNVWAESIGVYGKETGKITQSTETVEENNQVGFLTLPNSGVAPGSGRFYIWDRTISLIAEQPVLGYGLDTIAYEFPQDDIEKQAGLNTYKIIVDKPHNMYLGIAYGSGVFALLLFLSIVVILMFSYIRMIWQKRDELNSTYYLAITGMFVGVLAFLFQYLFNDSLLGPTNVMWVFIGILFGATWLDKPNKTG
ncbi:O-antigen ligase family protein [Aquibacillus salsiterrae]|uniref:O-antigen ligase family protein n=1 Tax=Aquibacillus salsiterrae TaxID=2950439 RepID=A0A9X3WAU3_9BACI|nr:O-antigen ligase family protein [Aquibacillus salsiterrae]MDC3415940.1 O-antigen ligase family protein [Aquibacillus salsiterrae]